MKEKEPLLLRAANAMLNDAAHAPLRAQYEAWRAEADTAEWLVRFRCGYTNRLIQVNSRTHVHQRLDASFLYVPIRYLF